MPKNKKKVNNNDLELGIFKTGFPMLDLLIGKDLIEDPNKPDKYTKIRGLRSGSQFGCVADSQYGKTTFLLNVAGNIVRKYFHEGVQPIHYISTEGGAELNRLCALTGVPYKKAAEYIKLYPRYELTTEYMYEKFLELYNEKIKNPEKYMGDVMLGNGQMVKRYLPTIWMIDSFSSLLPGALEEKDKVDNMHAATKVRINNNHIEKMRHKAAEVNIMMFIVQHEGVNINTNPYESRSNKSFGSDVYVKGGKGVMYESDVLVRIEHIVAYNKEKTDKKYSNTEGFSSIMRCAIAKNRFGAANDKVKFNLIQHDLYGFDPLHSYIYDVLDKEIVTRTKKGSSYYGIDGYDKSFFQKDIINLIKEDADFRKLLKKRTSEYFHDIIKYHDTDDILTETQNLINDLL